MINIFYRFFFFGVVFFSFFSVYAADAKIDNNRFDYIYNQSNISLQKGDFVDSKIKIYNFLDKTNFTNCNSYFILSSLDKGNSEIYDKINNSCKAFKNGDFLSAFKYFQNFNFENYKNNIDLYIILKLYYFEITRITLTEGYNKLYLIKDVSSFLNTNKVVLLQKFPITYNYRLGTSYYERKNLDKEKKKELFNNIYNDFLSKNDFIYKPFIEIYSQILNGYDINKLSQILNYENIIIKDNTLGTYKISLHKWIYKMLYQEYVKKDNKNKSVEYLFKYRFTDTTLNKNKLYDNYVFDYFKNIKETDLLFSLLDGKNVNLTGQISDESKTFYHNFIFSFDFTEKFLSNDYKYNEKEDYLNLSQSLYVLYDWLKTTEENGNYIDLEKDVSNLIKKSIIKISLLNKTGGFKIYKTLGDLINNLIVLIPELVKYENSFKTLNYEYKNTEKGIDYKSIFIYLSSFILFIFLIFIFFKTPKKFKS